MVRGFVFLLVLWFRCGLIYGKAKESSAEIFIVFFIF